MDIVFFSGISKGLLWYCCLIRCHCELIHIYSRSWCPSLFFFSGLDVGMLVCSFMSFTECRNTSLFPENGGFGTKICSATVYDAVIDLSLCLPISSCVVSIVICINR